MAKRPRRTEHEFGKARQVEAPEVMDTAAAAAFLSCSTQFLEIARLRGGGPPFSKLGPRLIRYRRQTLLEWLARSERNSTSEP